MLAASLVCLLCWGIMDIGDLVIAAGENLVAKGLAVDDAPPPNVPMGFD